MLALEELPWREEVVEEIAELFPQLEVLEISCSDAYQVSLPMHNLTGHN